jgi:hypothetical protein
MTAMGFQHVASAFQKATIFAATARAFAATVRETLKTSLWADRQVLSSDEADTIIEFACE